MNNQLEQYLSNLKVSLDSIYNVTSNLNHLGNTLLTQDTKKLIGYLDQPTGSKISLYYSAKSHFKRKGASEQAASGFAIIVANIAIKTGKTIKEVLTKSEELGITFDDEVYEQINKIKRPESQFFNFRGANPSLSYSRSIGNYMPLDRTNMLSEEGGD